MSYWDDDNDREVGGVFVTDYSEAREAGYDLDDIPYAGVETSCFVNYLAGHGFTYVFLRGNDHAWEYDFEFTGDIDWLVDIVYFCGHGSDTPAFWFGKDRDYCSPYVPFRVRYDEASWGTYDLEWIILQACRCLYKYRVSRWRDTFNGLHGICGFHTICYAYSDGRQGYYFAYYATQSGYGVGRAWREATKRAQPSYVAGAIYRAVIRIDHFVIDYYYEPLGAGYSDYTDPYVYLYGFRYSYWYCY